MEKTRNIEIDSNCEKIKRVKVKYAPFKEVIDYLTEQGYAEQAQQELEKIKKERKREFNIPKRQFREDSLDLTL